ncbi:hypothetical protein B9Z55_009490 [Caenorhabditis nigoni]|uniref:Tyrosine-protein phosphatase domain-containing protein n=1 Tax=Caenorhabditis nigoni TaxID=1611254 RepID=A0A2G5UT21_9PELO|nr:hypothetical protein B9Z55_009490 [Caenorhabditis nigoni]
MKKVTPTKNDSKRRTGANGTTDEAASKQTRRRRSRASKAVGKRGEKLDQERTDVSYRKKKKDPTKKASKAGSHAATPIGKSPQLVQPPTPPPKADKNEKVDTSNTVTTDEAITGGTTSLSTVSTVSTTLSTDLPPQTPPKVTGSTRKTKMMENEKPSIKAEKWGGETAAKAWMEKTEFSKVKADFEKINLMAVNVDKDCKKWKANSKWNQSEDYPALDSNLVKVEDVYVNMSQIDFPSTRSVLMGQIPKKDSEEAFWKVVFEKRILLIHVIVGSNDSFDFFPQKADEYRYYGSMFINNRRVENLEEKDICRFHIEVLPSGCSNSIVSTITVIKNWQIDTVHPKHSVVVKETFELTKYMAGATAEDTALVVSRHGAGRAGFFLSLWMAINKFDAKNEPCIADIVKTIRVQRPKAVETLTQYASLYITLFYFIKRKIVKKDADKKSDCQKNPTVKKSVELSQNFASALLADQSVIGTTTMLTLAPSAIPPTTPAIQGSSAVQGSAVTTVSGQK